MFINPLLIILYMDIEDTRGHISISNDSIKYMLKFIKKHNFKTVLEIGTLKGYSAMKFSAVAEKVVTIENSKINAKEAKENFEKLNVKNIELIYGDARTVMGNIIDKFDLIFIDATKVQYKEYLVLALKLLNTNGCIFADNTISHKEYMDEFFEYLKNNNIEYKELNIGKGLVLIYHNKTI